MHLSLPKLRVARPTDNLLTVMQFYRDGLGLQELSAFAGHKGFDGIMLGHPQAPYHFEFTYEPGHQAGRAPSADHLLVFYLPDAEAWQAAVQRMIDHGFLPIPAYNSYWDQWGRTFEDPDGYRVVLQQAAWDI